MLVVGMFWIFSSQRKNERDSAPQSSPGVVKIVNWKKAPRETGLRNGAFSPDGTMIAFSSNRADHSGIWIKQIDGGQPLEIIGDDWHNENPIWSPDGRQMAFVSDRGGHPGIWSIPYLGGTPALLITLQTGWPELTHWSKKTATIYYEWEFDLFALDLNSGQTTRITEPDSTRQSSPTFSISPEEDRLAYADIKNGHRDIWVKPLGGGEPTQVTDDPADDRYPIWRSDGESIIYSSNRRGTYQICMAYADARPPTQITFADTDHAISDISPDGGRILFVTSRDEGDLVKVDVETGQEVEITSDLGLELWPDVSADGKTIAFQETDARVKMLDSAILSKPPENSAQQLHLATSGFDPRWSPDGRRIGFLNLSNNLFNIWTVKATGEEQRQLTTGGIVFSGVTGLPYNRKQTRDYSWSPDGSKIAYCSLKSGQMNVWVVGVDNSGDNMISNNADPTRGLLCPLWSPDGNRIAYINLPVAKPADGGDIEIITATGHGEPNIVFHSDTILRLLGWSGHDLMAAVVKDKARQNTTTAQIEVFQISGNGGGNRKVAILASAYLTNIQLSPDGRSVAFVSRLDEQDNIWVVSTLDGAARKVTRNSDSRIYYSSVVWSPDGRAIYCSKQASWSLISMIDNFGRKDLSSWQKPPNQPAK
jgi:Tol biopolymer transport system component